MLIGNHIVSNHPQNLDLQRDPLKSDGREKIFVDEVSGAVGARPGLQEAMKRLREKDVLVAWRWTVWAGPSGTSSNR
jgi:DNA invertase Pin-like site-specific DNA recombinase